MNPLQARDHLRALALLVAGGAMLMAGFPGLDFASKKEMREGVGQAREIAAPLGTLVAGIAWFDLEVRRPLAELVRPVERTFRVAQEFHLYRDGPRRVDRLEVLVDGELVYRTRDAELDWRAAQFGNRHFRPMVATAAQKADAANQRGICRWIVARVQEDFPDAQEVVVRSSRTEFGVEAPWVRFSRVARAPDWTVSPVEKQEAP
jgi:hypothetical protein